MKKVKSEVSGAICHFLKNLVFRNNFSETISELEKIVLKRSNYFRPKMFNYLAYFVYKIRDDFGCGLVLFWK